MWHDIFVVVAVLYFIVFMGNYSASMMKLDTGDPLYILTAMSWTVVITGLCDLFERSCLLTFIIEWFTGQNFPLNYHKVIKHTGVVCTGYWNLPDSHPSTNWLHGLLLNFTTCLNTQPLSLEKLAHLIKQIWSVLYLTRPPQHGCYSNNTLPTHA